MRCCYNELTKLDVSSNVNLTELNCYLNELTELDISNNTNLTELGCQSNQITLLDVSSNTNLLSLGCGHNPLTELDISNNTNLISLSCSRNQLTELNVSNNPNLTYLYCGGNNLTELNVSNNTGLLQLHCLYNQLTELDVSNNTNLTILECISNQLRSLDVSNNISLGNLNCCSNQLTELDVSNNPNLARFKCYTNNLTELDVSNNPNLQYFKCYNNNNLTEINLKNGNNTILGTFIAYCNPNLTCIEVDDVEFALSQENWHIDGTAVYRIACDLFNHIYGSFLLDDDCVINGNEVARKGIIIKTEPDYHYGITNNEGGFDILSDTGTYVVEPIINHPLILPLCPEPFSHTVQLDSLMQDTSGLVFFAEIIECPILIVDISSNRRRRCFNSTTLLEYRNEGFADEDSVLLHVEFPEYVNLVSADYPYSIDSVGNYVFDIGILLAQTDGIIRIIDSVSCIDSITGLTQCTKAWITPPNDCLNNLDTTINEWDKSSITIPDGECRGDTLVRFTIINVGEHMQVPSEYRIYAENLLVFTEQFQLQANESLNIALNATGETIRLEADQHPAHPGNSHPNAVVEGCGNGGVPLNPDIVNATPTDDEDPEIEIDCLPIIDSYDPNDKQIVPAGIGDGRIVHPESILEYIIRFQNTGSDMAYNVVVLDTLPEHLDISTIHWGISSHQYNLEVSGQGRPVLSFSFEDINLPDVSVRS